MKKNICISIFVAMSLLIFSKAFSLASQPLKGCISSFQAPRWGNFCPARYQKVKFIESEKPNLAVNILLGASIIGIPTLLDRNSKYADIATSNYWANRRNTFYLEMKSCKGNKNYTMDCYARLKKREYEKTAEYNKEQLLKAQKAEARAKATTEILNEIGNAFAQALQEEVQRQITNKFSNNSNATTYSTNSNYSNDTGTTSDSDDQARFQTCHNTCSKFRVICRRGVKSAPGFGNDISEITLKNLAGCEENFGKCIHRCSCR